MEEEDPLEEYLAFRTGEEDRGSGTVAVRGGAAGGRCQSLEASRAATTGWSAGGLGGGLGGGGGGDGLVTLAIGQLDFIPGGEEREGGALRGGMVRSYQHEITMFWGLLVVIELTFFTDE